MNREFIFHDQVLESTTTEIVSPTGSVRCYESSFCYDSERQIKDKRPLIRLEVRDSRNDYIHVCLACIYNKSRYARYIPLAEEALTSLRIENKDW